jgi:hypothetical protein
MNLSAREPTGHPWYNIYDQGQRGTGGCALGLASMAFVCGLHYVWHCRVLGEFSFLFFSFVLLSFLFIIHVITSHIHSLWYPPQYSHSETWSTYEATAGRAYGRHLI